MMKKIISSGLFALAIFYSIPTTAQNHSGLYAFKGNEFSYDRPSMMQLGSAAIKLADTGQIIQTAHAKSGGEEELTDTNYYRSYADQITGRFYFSQKYTNLIIRDNIHDLDLDYKPNTTLNMGVGATYKSFTLNLAYGFGFLNKQEDRGETKYLDLQAHLYGRKSTIDLAGQFYKGFYLSPRGKATAGNSFYLRPDLRLREFGISYQYMFNYRRFSYRAAFIQNEWQQRSAGTFLLGGETYYGWAKADSSIYPTVISPAGVSQATQVRFFEIGPSAGYAYTLVIDRSFFLTGALSVSLDYSFSEYVNNDKITSADGISTNTFLRLVAGYNSARHAVSLTYTSSKMSVLTGNSNNISFNTGNIRLNFVRRFEPGPKTRKLLNKLDRWVK